MIKNEYFEAPGVSSSSLGWILPESGGSRERYKYNLSHPPVVEGAAVDLGSTLHKLIEITDKLKVKAIIKPGPLLKATIDAMLVHDDFKGFPIDSITLQKNVLEIAKKVGYGTGWKDDTIYRKVIEEGAGYFTEMRTLDDNTMLIDDEGLIKFHACTARLKETHPHIFDETMFGPNVEIRKEVKIFFKRNGLDCKALLDRLVINHENKTWQIEDLKTFACPMPEFIGYNIPGIEIVRGEVYNRHIYRQMAFYTMAVQQILPGYHPSKTPMLIALETTPPHECLDHYITESDLDLGFKRIEFALKEIKATVPSYDL